MPVRSSRVAAMQAAAEVKIALARRTAQAAVAAAEAAARERIAAQRAVREAALSRIKAVHRAKRRAAPRDEWRVPRFEW